MAVSRGQKGALCRPALLGPMLLVLLCNGYPCLAAPRPEPVQVYGGYSSISKSVTVTKRLEFHMNKDQALDNQSVAEDKDGVGTHSGDRVDGVVSDQNAGDGSTGTSSSNGSVFSNSNSSDAPLVNHSVQYSIETKSNVNGDLLPPMTLESVNNDLNEMQKMAEDNMKKTENMASIGHQTSTSRHEVQNSDSQLRDDLGDKTASLLDSQPRREDYEERQNSDTVLRDHLVDETTSSQLDFSEPRRDFYYEDENLEDSIAHERRDEVFLEPRFDILEVDVNEPFVTTLYEDQETLSTATKEVTTAIPEKQIVHQTTTPYPSTDLPLDDMITIDGGLNLERTDDEMIVKESVSTEPTATTTEMESQSAIRANEFDILFEENNAYPSSFSTEYPSTPEHINKKVEIPEQQTEESTLLENVQNVLATGNLKYESSTSDLGDVEVSTSNPTINILESPEPIVEVTKEQIADVLAEDHSVTTTEAVSVFIRPEEYMEKEEGENTNTEMLELRLGDIASETVSVTEVSSATSPVSLTADSDKETLHERIEFDQASVDEVMSSHSDSTIRPTEPMDQVEFENSKVAETATTVFESTTTRDEIGQIQFGRSPEEDIIVNQDYRDYNSEYVAGIQGDSTTSDYDYTTFGMGESFEIGGSFPTEEAYIEERRQQSLADAQGETRPERESFFGKIHEPPMEGNTEPTLDLSSILSGIDFTKIDFSKLDLSAMDLSGVDLSGLDFSQLPSNLDLEKLDMSKLPTNLDLSTLNLSSLPENLNISGIDLSKINISDIASNIDLDKLDLSNLQLKQIENVQQLPSSPEFANNKESSVSDVNSPFYDYDISDFQQSNLPSRFHTNEAPPFLLPNFNFDDSTVNQHFDSSRAPPSQLPPQFRFRPSQSPNFRPPSENFRPLSPGNFGLQQSSHYPPSDPPQFFLVDNFGNGEFVDPSAINIQDQSRYQQEARPDPSLFSNSNHPRRPDFNILQQSRFGDPNLLAIHQQQRQPSFQTAENVQFVPDIQYSEQDQVRVRPNRIPDFDFANLDLGELAGNLNLGEQDFSKLDLSQLPANLDLSGLDLSSIPSNFSLGGLDISKITSNLNLGAVDLSKINLKELDIPNILKKLSPGGLPSALHPTNEDTSNTRQGFAIGNFNKDTNTFDGLDENVSKKANRSYDAPIKHEAVLGSEHWVTEAEADQHLVDELGITHLVKMARALSFDGSGNVDFLLCTMCKTGVVTGKKLMNDLAKTDREIMSLVIYICIQFELFPGDVCRGMINIVGDEILHVLRTTPHQPETFCGMMLNSQCDDAPLPKWELQLPTLKSSKPDPITPPASGDLKILHISDLHLDSEYAEGTDADCGFPLCCRDWEKKRDGEVDIDQANKTKSSMDIIAMKVMGDADDPNMDAKSGLMSPFKFHTTAGKWGAFGRCDLPLRTIDNILEAGAALNPDIVYVTGDLPPHDVWQQTKESVKESIAITSDRVRAAFPNTPVVMTVGNHEIVPISSFPVPEVYGLGFNPSWLYESLALQWKGWVPATSMDTLRKGGFYSVTPRTGLRVLSVNGNYCNSMNWWLMLAHRDPVSQLEWLEEQMSAAEAAGEKVHILIHIPPGNADCEQSWSRQFAQIVSRHADTVTGVFSGHQHLDQWQVIFDPEDSSRAVGVTYIAPSATTYREHSPSFRMFTVDGKRPEATWTIVDHTTYTANLTEANKPGNSPHYAERYTAREAFDMADLSPSSWADVVRRMAVNQTMFNEHIRFKHNYWAEPTEVTACDMDCKTRSLCYLLTGDSSNHESCEKLKPNVKLT